MSFHICSSNVSRPILFHVGTSFKADMILLIISTTLCCDLSIYSDLKTNKFRGSMGYFSRVVTVGQRDSHTCKSITQPQHRIHLQCLFTFRLVCTCLFTFILKFAVIYLKRHLPSVSVSFYLLHNYLQTCKGCRSNFESRSNLESRGTKVNEL